jgi:hypothetical protein
MYVAENRTDELQVVLYIMMRRETRDRKELNTYQRSGRSR